MQTKIRVGAVSYLNTKPLIYGFQQGTLIDRMKLRIDFPSRIATMLKEDTIDVGLVPVVIIPELEHPHIISDYCISCDGPVASVALFSEVPLDQIRTILLDYQSKTSVELLKILIKEYWKIDPEIKHTSGAYQSGIKGTTGALVIGDRALEQRRISPYIYDLGQEWKAYTGFPFVFAAWVSNKQLDQEFIRDFNEANAIGLNSIDAVIKGNPYDTFDLREYYSRYIKFTLSDAKREALDFFLGKISADTFGIQ